MTLPLAVNEAYSFALSLAKHRINEHYCGVALSKQHQRTKTNFQLPGQGICPNELCDWLLDSETVAIVILWLVL